MIEYGSTGTGKRTAVQSGEGYLRLITCMRVFISNYAVSTLYMYRLSFLSYFSNLIVAEQKISSLFVFL
jgi:hypothetical protein